MAIKQQIKFKDEINFEADQQDAMKKTEGYSVSCRSS